MKKLINGFFLLLSLFVHHTCQQSSREDLQQIEAADDNFEYVMDRFADLQILRYKVEGFEKLDLQKKKLAFYLYQAALSGRDIIYDQNYKHNLRIRKTVEAIYATFSGKREGKEWQQFEVYAKRMWFSNGIHHHYAMTKILPDFSKAYFAQLIKSSEDSALPLEGVDKKRNANRNSDASNI